MDNQYNYNTPNDQFQNQATGNGGPDFHFGQTDPDFSHRKKEKKPRDHKKAAKIAGGLCFAVAFGVIASAAFQTTNFVGNALFGEKVKTEKSSEKKVDSTSLTRTSSTVTSDVSEVVNSVMPSVVSITNMSVQQVQSFFGGTSSQEVQSSGSGIIAGQNDTELLIITNNHVVEDSEELSVTFIDNQSVKAAVKGTDSDSDLAVIAVQLSDIPEETRKQIKAADLGDSDSLKLGQGVVAIGNALGQGQSVTVGYVSALNKKITINDVERTLLQVDAAINPGNSGGALLNMNGEVIGINAAKYSDTSVEGIGYAIPISQAKDIISDLMTKTTKVAVDENEQGYLGIQLQNIDSQMAQAYGMPEGIYVYKIVAGGAASRSDLRERDIITKFDGEKVKNGDDLKKMLTYYKAGSTVTMTVQSLENGKYVERNVQITLGSKSDMPQSQDSQNESRSESQASPQRKLGR